MTTTPSAPSEVEERLRAALSARAELVQAEDLAPLTPVVELRPRWQSPWVLLATAAVVLLVLGVVLQGVGGRERSDRVAPQPDAPRLELPADIGRDWKADDLSTPAHLDLDGDGVKEKVHFLGERTEDFDGRTRLETTLSSTGEEAYGIAELGTTIGINALAPIDADADGDQELVLYRDDLQVVGGGGHPLVFDLRDGLLVQAAVQDADLLVRGEAVVPGSGTEYYDLVHVQDYWVEDGSLHSSRSVGAYARGNMMRLTPRSYVLDTWEWSLDDEGLLTRGGTGCLMQGFDSRRACGADPVDTPVSLPVQRASYVGVGETVEFGVQYGFSARIEAGAAGPTLVLGVADAQTLRHAIDVPDPLLGTTQPISVFFDEASVVVTSASDPSVLQVLVQDADRVRVLDAVGEIAPTNDDDQRTWLTDAGAVLSAVRAEGDSWVLWQWMRVSRTEIAAMPWGTVCFDDVDEPTSIRGC
ncbi:MAG TPA: hypothetical protein VGV65_12140 [Nocardioides sp.]|nr:hypothetical protein [Nocardioides sp.]